MFELLKWMDEYITLVILCFPMHAKRAAVSKSGTEQTSEEIKARFMEADKFLAIKNELIEFSSVFN